MAIELTAIYLRAEGICVVKEDSTAEIVRDFVVGSEKMKKDELSVISRSLDAPNAEEGIKAAICDASWAGTRDSREFLENLVKSLGQLNCPSTTSLGQLNDPSTTSLGRLSGPSTFEEKMSKQDYESAVEALADDLA